MTTSDSFFPTKFRPLTANTVPDRNLTSASTSKTYKLLKKRTNSQNTKLNSVPSMQSVNIFKNNYLGAGDFDYEKQRPIGGVDMFLKEHNKKIKTASSRKLSQHRIPAPNDSKKREIQNQARQNQMHIQESEGYKTESAAQGKEQIYKQHRPYEPTIKIKARTTFNSKSQTFNRNQKEIEHENWVNRQTDNHQQKMAILGQIFYKKPLVERSGDRFFQMMIRNRFEDQPAPPTYIHQIKNQTTITNQKSKFLGKIKKLNPNIRNFQKLIIHGKNVGNKKMTQDSYY